MRGTFLAILLPTLFLGACSLLALVALAAAPPPTTTTPSATPPPSSNAAARFAPAPPGERALILWTASVQGYVEPCGCTAEPLGGVARLAGAVEEARRAWGERVVLLDAGDLLFEHADDNTPVDRCQAEARADLLIDSYARAGLRATVLGPLDDVRGPSFRDARLARAGVVTLGVGAPRALISGARSLPHLLIDAGGVRLGVTAFRAEAQTELATVRAALTREVRALQGEGARAVVALAQAPRDLTRAITRGLPGLDAVLQGRAPGELPADAEPLPDERGVGPVLLAAGVQAQHLGVLELVLEGRARGAPLPLDDRAAVASGRRHLIELKRAGLEDELARLPDGPRRAFLQERHQVLLDELAELERRAPELERARAGPHLRAWSLPLPRGSAEQPAIAAALASYQASVPSLVERCEADADCPSASPGAATFVGVAACRACHASAADFWQQQVVRRPGRDARGQQIVREIGHARAWDSLVSAKQARDRSCIPCHAVGFGLPGGPCKTTDVEAGGFAGVQCESCHGPGSMHVAAAGKGSIVRAADEARCRECHQVPHIPTTASFVFAERRRLILGPGHGLPLPGPPPGKERTR